jgi:hypothetical protein
MCVCYARLNLEEAIPEFKTLKEWEQKKSTKFDTCARVSLHLLSQDNAPTIYVEDGAVIFPSIPPPSDGEPVRQTLKLIIYKEFPSLGKLLRNVSHIIHCLYLCSSHIYYRC